MSNIRRSFFLFLILFYKNIYGMDFLEYRFLQDMWDYKPPSYPPVNIPINPYMSFGKTSDGSRYSIDTRLTQQGNNKNFIYLGQRVMLNVKKTIDGKPYEFIDSWIEIDCKNKLVRNLQDNYGDSGQLVKRVENNYQYSKIDTFSSSSFYTMYYNSFCPN